MAHYYRTAERAHNICNRLMIPFKQAWEIANCVTKWTADTKEEAEAKAAQWGNEAYECWICGKWHTKTRTEMEEEDE